MKNVPIKFRGVGLRDGKYRYGWYSPITPIGKFPAILDEEGYYSAVKADTVKQLVGYDAEGNEVYEGDELTDKFGHELTARIESIAENTNPRKFFRASWGCNFDFKLKKQGD